MTVKSIVDNLGGTFKVAEMLGVVPGAVSNMKSANRFPMCHFFALKKACRKKRIRLPDDLFGNGN